MVQTPQNQHPHYKRSTVEACDSKCRKISREDTRGCMCHDAEGNYLWSRTYIVVASVHFECKTVLPVAANVGNQVKGFGSSRWLYSTKEMRFCPVKKRRDISRMET